MSNIVEKNLSDFIENVSPDQLRNEITSNVDISSICYRVQSVETNVSIIFESSLSETEQNIVDILVSQHIPDIDTNTGAEVGLQGNIVGTTDSQNLVNKMIDGDLNTVINIDNDSIKVGAAIDADKIYDGSVSNAEFGYLNGVTSSIQSQINSIDQGGSTYFPFYPFDKSSDSSSYTSIGSFIYPGGTIEKINFISYMEEKNEFYDIMILNKDDYKIVAEKRFTNTKPSVTTITTILNQPAKESYIDVSIKVGKKNKDAYINSGMFWLS